MNKCIYPHEGVEIIVSGKFGAKFKHRNHNEVIFRKLVKNLMYRNIIGKHKNIIDLGTWIGDMAIPWAMMIKGTVYAIDPSDENCEFVEEMAKVNGLDNVKVIQTAVSDKVQTLSTRSRSNHMTLNDRDLGDTKLESTSLDTLYKDGTIENVGYIHLDVEGMEWKVLRGATELIDDCRPVIIFEQHLDKDQYRELSWYVGGFEYVVFMIDEVMRGTRLDCRNFLAVPKEKTAGGEGYLQWARFVLEPIK